MADEKYKNFHAALIPTVDPSRIIGIRVPALRAYAKKFAKSSQAHDFLESLPHTYYEEDNLHAFVLETFSDYNSLIDRLNIFLPYIDNWATCDMMRPKILKKHPGELLSEVKKWLLSPYIYEVRFALGCLMSYYLNENFTPEILELAASVAREEYYVSMMQAWFFATALSFKYDETLPYIKDGSLNAATVNRAIQKAVESRRITPEKKAVLRQLRKR